MPHGTGHLRAYGLRESAGPDLGFQDADASPFEEAHESSDPPSHFCPFGPHQDPEPLPHLGPNPRPYLGKDRDLEGHKEW